MSFFRCASVVFLLINCSNNSLAGRLLNTSKSIKSNLIPIAVAMVTKLAIIPIIDSKLIIINVYVSTLCLKLVCVNIVHRKRRRPPFPLQALHSLYISMENLRRYGVSPSIVGSLVLLLSEVQVRSGKVEQIKRFVPLAKHDAKIGILF